MYRTPSCNRLRRLDALRTGGKAAQSNLAASPGLDFKALRLPEIVRGRLSGMADDCRGSAAVVRLVARV
jgi:hypothetical protein